MKAVILAGGLGSRSSEGTGGAAEVRGVSGLQGPCHQGSRVTGFHEKPHGDGGWINGDFFVLSPEVAPYLDGGDAMICEREPLERLARDGELAVYEHGGFWQPMDTQRDMRRLQAIWDSGDAPWTAAWR